MDNALCLWALVAIGVNMAHYIVAEFFLIFLRNFVINIIGMSLKLIDLLLCNIKSKLMLRFGKCNPKFSPCFKLKIRRINILHFLACISCIEG